MKLTGELKMYSMVLYQLSKEQGCIQAGHANVEYGVVFGMEKNTDYYKWASQYKTHIVLNGGTSDKLKESTEYLKLLGVTVVEFVEPHLYNQVTAISFLVDEETFNKDVKDLMNVIVTGEDNKTLLKVFLDSFRLF